MAETLTEALRDLDLVELVKSNDHMNKIKAALEANTDPAEAKSIVESLTRFVVERTGESMTRDFADALRKLTELQETVQSKYDAAVQGGKRAPASIDSEIRPLLTERARLFDKITRLASDPDQLVTSADAQDVLGAFEEQGRPTHDVTAEGRGEAEFVPDDPELPRGSPGARAEVTKMLDKIQPRDKRYEFVARRPKKQKYAHEQFQLLRDLDPDAAGSGYEVDLIHWDVDPPKRAKLKPRDWPLKLDGIHPTTGDRFEMLEGKYSGFELGPDDELYPDRVGDMRAQFGRQLAAMDMFGDQCDGLRVVTNSPRLAELITGVLEDVAGTKDLKSKKIFVEVKVL
jgi:hypothetical protein